MPGATEAGRDKEGSSLGPLVFPGVPPLGTEKVSLYSLKITRFTLEMGSGKCVWGDGEGIT